MSIHVIPVPDGYTVDDALMEIQVFGHLYEREAGTWAVVEVDE